jgi:vacuolar-type H+-ATPase subunit D/Vma8
MYDKLGKISIENYELFMGKKAPKNFEEALLYNSINLDIGFTYKYIFGIVIASFMHQKSKKDATFVAKTSNFNMILKSNPTLEKILDAFHSIDLDIYDFELLERSLVNELETLKDKQPITM